MFLLRPGKRTNEAILYALAVAAERHGIDVHWICAPSNHGHLGATDRRGTLPDFLRDFHHWTAKLLNVQWKRWGSVWDSEQTSVVDLVTPDDAFDKQTYSLGNPVKDFLVERARDWPGVSSLSHQLCDKTITLKRPTFFDNDGTMPEEITLRFTRIPGFEHLSQKAWAEKITAAVEAVEAKAAHERARRGTRVLGRNAVLAQSAFDSPKTQEDHRQLRPRVACKNTWRRVETLQRNKQWHADYRGALDAYRAGDKSARFPHGTWQLAIDTHVLCAPGPGPLAIPYALLLRAA
jgi:hypothetical protein